MWCMQCCQTCGFVYGFLQKYWFWEEKYKFLKSFENLTWFLPKVPIISKNASNKSCPKLISCEKLTGCISLSHPEMKLGDLKHLPFLNDAIEWNSRFTIGWNVPKSTVYIKKYFNQKLSKIKFPIELLLGGRICQSLPVWS